MRRSVAAPAAAAVSLGAARLLRPVAAAVPVLKTARGEPQVRPHVSTGKPVVQKLCLILPVCVCGGGGKAR